MSALNYLYDGEPSRIEKLQEATDDNNGVIDDEMVIEIMEGFLEDWKINQMMDSKEEPPCLTNMNT